jgi:5-methyltetrahydrofolate--homocysteine methyltransferase
VRIEWGYGKGEKLTQEDLIAEKYRGIRPAPGYPSQPDHTEKPILFKLLDGEKATGIALTESFAMYPAASVCGSTSLTERRDILRSAPSAKTGRHPLCGAQRDESGRSRRRWLSPILGYDPALTFVPERFQPSGDESAPRGLNG